VVKRITIAIAAAETSRKFPANPMRSNVLKFMTALSWFVTLVAFLSGIVRNNACIPLKL
jgi:hypothetical protein